MLTHTHTGRLDSYIETHTYMCGWMDKLSIMASSPFLLLAARSIFCIIIHTHGLNTLWITDNEFFNHLTLERY